MNLKERQELYEDSYNYKIIRKLPILIKVECRNYYKITKYLEKPFSNDFLTIMAKTMLHSIVEIEGIVFAYYYNGIIYFVIRNDKHADTDPWFGNNIQKISSATSSIVTSAYVKTALSMDLPNITDDALFSAHVFALPSIDEVVNYFILVQHECLHSAINVASSTELTSLYGKDMANDLLSEASIDDKIKILKNSCDISFNDYYSSSFTKGIAAYKIPIINESQLTKYKWIIDTDLPAFHEDKNFIFNIINSGHDIFRENRRCLL